MRTHKHQECDVASVGALHHKAELPAIVEAIVASCRPDDPLSHLDITSLPSREKVREILQDVESILYPGFFGNQEIERHNLTYHVGGLVNRVYDDLTGQIARVFTHLCARLDQATCRRCGEQGEQNALALLGKVPALRERLMGDVRAAFQSDPAAKSYDEIIFSYPGIQAITIYRIAHELWVQGVPILPRIMTETAHGATGIDIHPGATIGKNFFIDHGTGVVIGETSVIGDNVRIYQGVTLGALRVDDAAELRGVKRHPTIEDDVTIYAGATILGGDVTIGRGSTIGGNVWLVTSVPPETMVSSAPQQHRFHNVNGHDPEALGLRGGGKEGPE
jgi:serine O-acetyltransferase